MHPTTNQSANTTHTQDAGSGSGSAQKTEGLQKPLGFWQQRPIHKSDSPIPASILSRVYNTLAVMPLLPLLGILAVSLVFSIGVRELSYYGETLTATALDSFLKNPEAAVYTGSIPYLEMSPLYFAFLWGIKSICLASKLFIPDTTQLLYIGTALSAALFVLAAQLQGRFVARIDGRALLGSGIMLLFSMPMLAFTHHTGAELFTAFCTVIAQIFFYHALARPLAFFSFALAFIFSTAAFLSGGLPGFVLPLTSAFLFSLWRKTPMRFFKLDFLVGLSIAFLVVGTWGVGISIQTDSLNYLESFLIHALPTTILGAPLATASFLLITSLPWLLMLICTRWHRVFTKEFYANLSISQKPAADGLAFLWFIVLVHVAALFVFGIKNSLYFLPALPSLSIIASRHFLRFSFWQAAFTRYALGIFFIMLGIAGIVFVMMLSGSLNSPDFLHMPAWRVPSNTFLFAAPMLFILLGTNIILLLKSSRPEGSLLLIAVFFTCFSFLLGRYVTPLFNPVLSPAHNAQLINMYANAGYKAFGQDADKLIYTFGSGVILSPLPASPEKLTSLVLENTPFIADVSAEYLKNWPDKPTEIQEAGRQWLGTKEHILLVYPALYGQPTKATEPDNTENLTPEMPIGAPIEQDMTFPEQGAGLKEPTEQPLTQIPNTEDQSNHPPASPNDNSMPLPEQQPAPATEQDHHAPQLDGLPPASAQNTTSGNSISPTTQNTSADQEAPVQL